MVIVSLFSNYFTPILRCIDLLYVELAQVLSTVLHAYVGHTLHRMLLISINWWVVVSSSSQHSVISSTSLLWSIEARCSLVKLFRFTPCCRARHFCGVREIFKDASCTRVHPGSHREQPFSVQLFYRLTSSSRGRSRSWAADFGALQWPSQCITGYGVWPSSLPPGRSTNDPSSIPLHNSSCQVGLEASLPPHAALPNRPVPQSHVVGYCAVSRWRFDRVLSGIYLAGSMIRIRKRWHLEFGTYRNARCRSSSPRFWEVHLWTFLRYFWDPLRSGGDKGW